MTMVYHCWNFIQFGYIETCETSPPVFDIGTTVRGPFMWRGNKFTLISNFAVGCLDTLKNTYFFI